MISVIVICYNQAHFLEDCLKSIHNQTYSDWECIIIDDGSKDNTKEVVNKWLEKDKRFLYFYQENKERSCTRNLGISKVRGKYIQFLF